MVMRVQHVDGEYRVVLSAEAMEAMHLSEGAAVEIKPVDPALSHYMTVEEGMAAFERIEPLHRNTFRELAK